MSRCFPYPPPGYALSGASKEALIESIKLQKGKEKSRGQRKEKKDKRREKKEKAHQNLDKLDIVQGHNKKKFLADVKGDLLKGRNHSDKKSLADVKGDLLPKGSNHNDNKFLADVKGDLLPKGRKVEPEQLERSTLSEEHGQPIQLRVPSTSSDSTENSNKRKRQSSPTEVIRGHGKIIRIRLSKKQDEPEASAADAKQICSTSGRTEVPPNDKNDFALRHHRDGFCSTTKQTHNILQEQRCLTQPADTISPGGSGIPPATNPVMTKMQKKELKYNSLFENWALPQLQDAPLDPGDQDWLFGGKKDLHAEKRHSPIKDTMPCSSNSSLWPHAQYLQKVDIYALPFTVPF